MVAEVGYLLAREAGPRVESLFLHSLADGELAAQMDHAEQAAPAVSLGTAALQCGRRSAELLPGAAELEHRLVARFPDERLVGTYGEALREACRVLPPSGVRRLHELVGRRIPEELSSEST